MASSYSPAHTTQAIIDLLTGDIGTTAKVLSGVFAFGTFAGQPVQAEQAKAVQVATARNRFDVQLGTLQLHDASPMSAQSNRRIGKVAVRIDITTHCLTTIQETARKAVRARIEQDANSAIRALRYPGNLDTDDDGNATGIVGGLLRGEAGAPAWAMDEEEWDKRVIRSHIDAEAIVEIVQAEEPDTIYGSDLEAWYRSDDGTFSQGVVSQVDDKTANANHLTASGSPAYTDPGALNYTPTVVFDGTDDTIKKASGFTLGTQDLTAWLLVKANAWTNAARVMWLSEASGVDHAMLTMATGSDRWLWTVINTLSATASSATGANDSGYHLIRVHIDSASANTIGIGVDGETPTTGAWTDTNGDMTVLKFGIGHSELSNWAAMELKEAILVGAVSTTDQDAKALDYFRARYALDL